MWKDINGWEEYYEVNENGEVRNKIRGTLLTGDINTAGYYRVCLYHKGHMPAKQRFFRHRLVAEHFIPNPLNLPEVNHINLDKSDNSVSNLEWTTRIDNEMHCRLAGKKPYRPYRVVFSDGSIKTYDVKREFANEIGVTEGMVRFWLHGESDSYLDHDIQEIQYI